MEIFYLLLLYRFELFKCNSSSFWIDLIIRLNIL